MGMVLGGVLAGQPAVAAWWRRRRRRAHRHARRCTESSALAADAARHTRPGTGALNAPHGRPARRSRAASSAACRAKAARTPRSRPPGGRESSCGLRGAGDQRDNRPAVTSNVTSTPSDQPCTRASPPPSTVTRCSRHEPLDGLELGVDPRRELERQRGAGRVPAPHQLRAHRRERLGVALEHAAPPAPHGRRGPRRPPRARAPCPGRTRRAAHRRRTARAHGPDPDTASRPRFPPRYGPNVRTPAASRAIVRDHQRHGRAAPRELQVRRAPPGPRAPGSTAAGHARAGSARATPPRAPRRSSTAWTSATCGTIRRRCRRSDRSPQ